MTLEDLVLIITIASKARSYMQAKESVRIDNIYSCISNKRQSEWEIRPVTEKRRKQHRWGV